MPIHVLTTVNKKFPKGNLRQLLFIYLGPFPYDSRLSSSAQGNTRQHLCHLHTNGRRYTTAISLHTLGLQQAFARLPFKNRYRG